MHYIDVEVIKTVEYRTKISVPTMVPVPSYDWEDCIDLDCAIGEAMSSPTLDYDEEKVVSLAYNVLRD